MAPTPAPGWSVEELATRAHDATGVLTLGSDGPGQIEINGTIKTGSTNNRRDGRADDHRDADGRGDADGGHHRHHG